MKQQIEEQITKLYVELNGFVSMKERKIISQKELDIISNAINEELYHLYRSIIMN